MVLPSAQIPHRACPDSSQRGALALWGLVRRPGSVSISISRSHRSGSMIGSSHDDASYRAPLHVARPATCEASSASRSDTALNGFPVTVRMPRPRRPAATARSEMPRSSTSVTASWSTLASSGTVISRLACLGADGSIIRP